MPLGYLYSVDVRRSDKDEVWVRFRLMSNGAVKVNIYNSSGSLVHTITAGVLPAGEYNTRSKAVFWDRNTSGGRVSSGVYFAELLLDDATQAVAKFVLS